MDYLILSNTVSIDGMSSLPRPCAVTCVHCAINRKAYSFCPDPRRPGVAPMGFPAG